MDHLIADLLLGLIEGITEFLPISSTGHLLIAERWLGARSDLFNIAIQAGAILAVVLIYRERLWQLLRGLRAPANRDYAAKLAVAFGVTAVLGLTVKKLGFELPETVEPIAWALVIGGFVMLGAEAVAARRAGRGDVITWPVAVLVGVAQVLAGVFPGTSRSAAAIFAALLFGTGNRVVATEFAFLIGIPTMFAATGYELLHVLRDGGAAGEDWGGLAVAFVTSAITAFIAVKWLLGYIQTHKFTVFAWYRIVLGAVLLASTPDSVNGAVAATHVNGQLGAAAVATRVGQPLEEPADANASAAVSRNFPPAAVANAAARAFESLRYCIAVESARRGLEQPLPAWARDHAFARATEAQKQEARRQETGLRLRVARDAPACARFGSRLDDGSVYGLALRAAEGGDRDAAFCYVVAGMPMSLAMASDPRSLDAYRVNARRFLQQGLERGEWRMVEVALVAHNAIESVREGPLGYSPGSGPGYAWMSRIFPKGDAERTYGLTLLQALGSTNPQEAEGPVRAMAVMRDWISDQQAARAERWARQVFATNFGGRKDRRGGLDFCTGLELPV